MQMNKVFEKEPKFVYVIRGSVLNLDEVKTFAIECICLGYYQTSASAWGIVTMTM